LDEWPEDAMLEYENQMLEFMESKHSDTLNDIKEKEDISDETDEKLKKALDEGNATALEREAHTVKGAGVNMGADKFGELALALERKGKSGSLEGAQDMLAELEAEFRRVNDFLEEQVIIVENELIE